MKFINQTTKTNMYIMKDVLHLCTIELTFF